MFDLLQSEFAPGLRTFLRVAWEEYWTLGQKLRLCQTKWTIATGSVIVMSFPKVGSMEY